MRPPMGLLRCRGPMINYLNYCPMCPGSTATVSFSASTHTICPYYSNLPPHFQPTSSSANTCTICSPFPLKCLHHQFYPVSANPLITPGPQWPPPSGPSYSSNAWSCACEWCLKNLKALIYLKAFYILGHYWRKFGGSSNWNEYDGSMIGTA